MATKHEDGNRQDRREEQHQVSCPFRIDTEGGEPASENGEGYEKDLREVEARSPTHPTGKMEKRYEPVRCHEERQQEDRDWEKPLDPILDDEFVRAFENVER